MSASGWILAVEDPLGEAVCLKLLDRVGVQSPHVLAKRGNTYLKSKVRELNRTSQRLPVLLVTDLDRLSCPAELIQSWLGGDPLGPRFLLRVAVREIESWIMADRAEFAEFLGIPAKSVPSAPDEVEDAKARVVRLSRSSPRRELRRALVPADGATSRVGPGYNSEFSRFIRDRWSPDSAAKISPSLRRSFDRLSRSVQLESSG